MVGRKVLMLLVTAVLFFAVGAQSADPSTEEERAKALDYVSVLESQPGTAKAKEALVWLTAWLARIPDITVMACVDVLGPDRKREGIPAALQIHHVYAQAAYQIRHPEVAPDSAEVFLAGVEGTLRTYEALRAREPSLRFPLLESLAVKQESGELRKYVTKRSRSCR